MPGKGSLQYKNRKWYLVISISEGGGRYRQKWLPLKAKTEKQAKDERDQVWLERRRGEWVEPKKITVHQVFERWIKHLKNRPKPARRRTIEGYKSIYKTHIREQLGHVQIQKLTAKMVRELIESKESQWRARRTYDVLHAMIELAYKDGDTGLKENVCKRIDTPPLEYPELEVWAAEQCRAFLAALKGHRYYGVFLCAMTTGMRIGEVLGLRWRDVDLKKRVISVRQTLEPKESGNPEIQIGEPKTKASKASLMMTDLLVEELKKTRERQMFERSGYREEYKSFDFVFKSTKGGPLNLEYLRRKVMNRMIEEAGLPKIRIHDLRHSAATLLRSTGVDIRTVQRYLRHANLAATQIYAHDDGVEFLEEATQKMNKVLQT